MRLNGTYLDRFVISTLPYSILSFLFIHFAENSSSFHFEIIMFLIITILIWLVDSISIYFKKLKPLEINDGIYIDNKLILPSSIIEIRRIGGRHSAIEFEVQENDLMYSVSVLEKPTFVLTSLLGKKSEILTKLLEVYPELSSKII